MIDIGLHLAWMALLLLHLVPGAAAFNRGLMMKLYGISPHSDVGVLLSHRAILFSTVAVTTGFGWFSSVHRPLSCVVLWISMGGFVVLYMQAGRPNGALRRIAVADCVGLVPLSAVTFDAFRG